MTELEKAASEWLDKQEFYIPFDKPERLTDVLRKAFLAGAAHAQEQSEERGAREMAETIRECWCYLSNISTGKDRTEDWIAKWNDTSMQLWRKRREKK